jgi:alpha-galactosidase/6-phospho-beta-glucosidase family protein
VGPTITIVGGGSFQWAPILLADIAATPDLRGARVVLQDLNEERLTLVQRWADVMLRSTGAEMTVESTTELAAAARGAAVVVLCISTGGLEAMRHDIEIPARYGVPQSVGDTVGPGGISRALRNIPVVVGIARTIERVAPDAFLLNLTNPMTTLCRAVTRTTGLRTVGLCHELFGSLGMLSRLFDVPESALSYRVAGINHLTWLLDVQVEGKDAFPRLHDAIARDDVVRIQTPREQRRPSTDNYRFKLELFERFGALPVAGDRHLAEFFAGALDHADEYEVALTTIEDRYALVGGHRQRVEAQIAGQTPMPTTPSREEVAPIAAAIWTNKPSVNVINLPNEGQIDNLPRGVVVETLGVVDRGHARGVSSGSLPPAVQGIVQRHVVNQELTVEAALTGDRAVALQALLGDPLVRDFATAPRMLDDLLAANRQLLPQFD